MFDKDRLALLEKQFSDRSFFFFDSIDSTNAFAKKAKVIQNNPAVILAYEQFAGAGQRAKSWVTEPGKNLTFSLSNKPPSVFNTQHYLLAISLAITSVLKDKLGLDTQIKWPNDILVNGKKIAGILVEAIFEGNHFKSLITGIGLNVNQIQFPPELLKPVGSLKLELKSDRDIDLMDLLSWLIHAIDKYTLDSSKEYYVAVFKEVNELLAYKNEKVKVLINRQSTIIGTIIGIDDNGALWVRDEQENFRKFLNEQISISAIK
jgi:BirA family biotin operon repressor/biotin-[acetyl-CoA-carboxylase] ligase